MRRANWATVLMAALPLLAGCGNFWQPPSGGGGTTGGCTSNCSTATSGNFYVLSAGDTPEIIGEFSAAGALTGISGSPWVLEGTPYSMAISPTGDFLVVSTTSGVFSYPITNGVLGTAVTVSTDQAFGVKVDATSKWLIEALPNATTGSVTVGAVPIDTTTGASAGTEQTATFNVTNASLQTNRLVLSGDNTHIFVSLGAGGTLVVPFNSAVGSAANPLGNTATTIPVAAAGGSALSVAVDPGTAPRLFYIGETRATGGATGGLRIFNYSSLTASALTQATGSPIASGGTAPNYILPDATGAYVYVANGTGTSTAGNVAGFTITASSASTPVYTIATDASTAAGVQPLQLAEDSTGTFVIAVGSLGSPYFETFDFDATTLGQLDAQITSSTAASYIGVVAAP